MLSWLVIGALAAVLAAVRGAAVTEALRVHLTINQATGKEVWTPREPGEVRCFCNLPLCVTSGYMCKSAVGGCFSDLFDFRDVYKARHGCVELLDSSRQGQCQNEPGSKRGHPRSLLLCCNSDMCNHVDSPEIKLRVNDSFLGHVLNSTESRVVSRANYTNNTEVWFKAATIAVPICGALILFLLIALAVKMLRRDGSFDDDVVPKHDAGYTSSKKMPLLRLQHEENRGLKNASGSYEKNDTNARLNFVSASKFAQQSDASVPKNKCNTNTDVVRGCRLTDVHCKQNNNNYRDMNITLPVTLGAKTVSDKYYDKQSLGFCENAVSPTHV